MPSVLQLMQTPTDEHYTCHLCCSWCRLRLTNTIRVVCAEAGAGSESRALLVPSVLQLVQAPTDGHHTCRLYCS